MYPLKREHAFHETRRTPGAPIVGAPSMTETAMPQDTLTPLPWRKALLGAAMSAVVLAGCHEVPQTARKPFAPASAIQTYESEKFEDNRPALEKALTARAKTQNEYNRIK
jgi:hypothetical protein